MRWMLTLIVVCVLTAPGLAQEWTRFRGPNGSGVNEKADLPAKWSDSDYRWRIDLPGAGQGSPVLWGKKLFILSGEEKTGERMFLCIDAATGKTLWEKKFASETYRMHRYNTYASSTAAVDAERVYIPWGTPEHITMKAFTHDGKDVWEADLGPFRGGHGFGASPIIVDDLLIMTNEQEKGPSSLIALDKKTGKKRWESPRDTTRGTYSTPCVYQSGDLAPQLILTNWDLGITSIDPRTGKTNWENRHVFGTKEERAIGSPITGGGLVLATCGFAARPKNLIAVDPTKARGGTVETIYKHVESWVSHIPTPLILGDRVYVWSDSGFVTCLELKTGKQVFQSRVENAPGSFFSSPVTDGKKIFSVTEYGDVVVIKAGDTFEQLAVNKLDDLIRSTPAIANGDLYIRTHHKLFCVKGE